MHHILASVLDITLLPSQAALIQTLLARQQPQQPAEVARGGGSSHEHPEDAQGPAADLNEVTVATVDSFQARGWPERMQHASYKHIDFIGNYARVSHSM